MPGKGRPSKYTQALADKICERLAAGETLRAICRDDEMPGHPTVLRWANENEAFSDQYAKARERGYAVMFDEMLEIADTPVQGVTVTNKLSREGAMYDETKRGDMIDHRRLQVDTRKWILAKALPKVYGDKLDLNHGGTVNIVSALDAARDRAKHVGRG